MVSTSSITASIVHQAARTDSLALVCSTRSTNSGWLPRNGKVHNKSTRSFSTRATTSFSKDSCLSSAKSIQGSSAIVQKQERSHMISFRFVRHFVNQVLVDRNRGNGSKGLLVLA